MGQGGRCAEAGGAPAEFNTVAPCDGIAQGQGMHAILPLRDVIAASVELMALANRFDGLVMLCSCDKIVPGMLIAAARAEPADDLRARRADGAGHDRRSRHRRAARFILSDVKEAMGRYKAGRITEDEFYEIERCACPGPGVCGFMGTANTMARIVETLGLALPGVPRCPRSIPRVRNCAAPPAGASSIWCEKACGRGRC